MFSQTIVTAKGLTELERSGETGKLEKPKRHKTKEPNKVGANGMRRQEAAWRKNCHHYDNNVKKVQHSWSQVYEAFDEEMVLFEQKKQK